MARLEDLVPSPEVCAKIPQGRFSESALAWVRLKDFSLGWVLVKRSDYRNISGGAIEYEALPAPLMPEVLYRDLPAEKIKYRINDGLEVMLSRIYNGEEEVNTLEAEEERRRKPSDGADLSDKPDREAGYVTAALVAERKREKAFRCALAEAKEAAEAAEKQLDKIEKTLDALEVMLALGEDEEAEK